MNGVLFASMSGNYSTQFLGSYDLLSQSVEGNYSVIRLYGTFRYSGGTSVSGNSSGYYFKVNGTNVYTGNYRFYPGDTQLGFVDITVYHNADGTFPAQTISISANSYHMSGSASGTISGIATIPRASTPSLSAYDVAMGNAVTIYTNPASVSFYHTIECAFAGTTYTLGTGVGSSLSWTIPKSLANSIPNNSHASCTIYCYTYINGTYVGFRSCSMTIYVSPDIKPTVTAVVEDPTGYKTTFGAFVVGKSKYKVTLTEAGSYSSSISGRTITMNGSTYTLNPATSEVLQSASMTTVVCKSVDSRNISSDALTKTQSVLDYSVPKINSFSVSRCKSDGTADDSGENAKVSYDIAINPLNNLNTKSLKVKYKKVSDTTFTEQIITLSTYSQTGSIVITGINGLYSYDFVLVANDYFNIASEKSMTLSTGFTLMDFSANGKGLAFGKASEKDVFECAMPAEFTKGLTVNGGSSMFNPTIVPNGTDFNTLKTAGWYAQGANLDVTNNINMPPAYKQAFIMQVLPIHDSGTLLQRVYYYGSGIFQRSHYGWDNTWTDWYSNCVSVQLWGGNAQSGSITVPGISCYKVFAINIGGLLCISAKRSDGYIWFNSGFVDGNYITVTVAFNIVGDTMTFYSSPLTLEHIKGGTHSAIGNTYVYEIWGLA